MRKEYYSCDIGSVAVACGGSIIYYNNGYGDCSSKVYEFEAFEEFNAYKKQHSKYGIEEKDYHYLSVADFDNANVLDYDCLDNPIPLNKLREHTLFTLNGRYFIYCNQGKVYFVKNVSKMKKFVVRCKENGQIFERFDSKEEAFETIKEFEDEDKKNGDYIEDFYEVAEWSSEVVDYLTCFD